MVLVLSALVLLTAVPLLELRGKLFVPLALLTVMAAVLRTLSPTRTVFRVCLIIGLVGFASQLGAKSVLKAGGTATVLNGVGLVAYTSFS